MKACFKSLAVPVFGLQGDMAAVDFAAQLARAMKAEIGVQFLGRSFSLLTEPEKQGYWSRYKAGGFKAAFDLLDSLFEARMKERAAEVERTCAERMTLHKISRAAEAAGGTASLPHYRWKQNLDVRTDVGEMILNEALRSDCTIITVASMIETGRHELAVTVPAGTGRPLVVLPAGPSPSGTPARNIVIAWKSTVHTIRAIDQAMPLLQAAATVTLLEIEEGKRQSQVTASQVARLLSLHGVDAKVQSMAAGSSRPQEVFNQELSRQGCDFLVMGAYSRPRTREIIFGGFTEYVLDNMKVPTLLAH